MKDIITYIVFVIFIVTLFTFFIIEIKNDRIDNGEYHNSAIVIDREKADSINYTINNIEIVDNWVILFVINEDKSISKHYFEACNYEVISYTK